MNQTRPKSDYLSSSFSQHEKNYIITWCEILSYIFTDFIGPQNNLESYPPKSTQIGHPIHLSHDTYWRKTRWRSVARLNQRVASRPPVDHHQCLGGPKNDAKDEFHRLPSPPWPERRGKKFYSGRRMPFLREKKSGVRLRWNCCRYLQSADGHTNGLSYGNVGHEYEGSQ